MIGSLNASQIEFLLQSQLIGRLGCHANGITYVVPLTYVYKDGFIYARTKEGLKIEMMRKHPDVCFEVDEFDTLANWRSAILQGTYEELKGKHEDEALLIIRNRIHPYPASETAVPRHSLERPNDPIDPEIMQVVFRIRIRESSGKFERS